MGEKKHIVEDSRPNTDDDAGVPFSPNERAGIRAIVLDYKSGEIREMLVAHQQKKALKGLGKTMVVILGALTVTVVAFGNAQSVIRAFLGLQ